MSSQVATVAEERARASRLDRALAALPVAAIFLWLVVVYAWESIGKVTPTIFSDELKWTDIARSLADHGTASIRGDHVGFQTLYAYLIAPAFWVHSTTASYDAVKYINVVTMSATVVPAYLLARRLVSKPSALLVAAASAAIPSMAYGLYIIPEVLAYPWAILCAWLIVEALATLRRRWIAAAVIASLLAPAVRGQLVVVPAAFAGAALALWWKSEGGRRFRRDWSRADTLGGVLLAFGLFVIANRWLGNGSAPWHTTTTSYKGRIVEQIVWSMGALTIGLGILPVVGGLTALVPRRGERLSPHHRAFVATASFFLLVFALYTGVKGAYLSLTFATRVTERNMIYVSPLLLLGTAIALERRRVRLLPLAAATGLVAWFLAATPLQLDYPYFEALGFSLPAFANRDFYWPVATIHLALWITLAIAVAVLLVAWALRGPLSGRLRAAAVTGGALVALAVVAWNLGGQVNIALGANDGAKQTRDNLPQPPDWIDQAVGPGKTVTYFGQHITDPNGENLLEFWNRSIVKVWSTDGSAPTLTRNGTLTPNLARIDGTLTYPPGTDYVVADAGVDLAGTPIASRGPLRVYPLHGGPIKLRDSVENITGDGWMSTDAAYNQFSTAGDRRGTAVVTLSRVAYCGSAPAGVATIEIGRIVIGSDKEAALGRVWDRRTVSVPNCVDTRVRIPVGRPPWRVQVHLKGTFSTPSDSRHLGAMFGVSFAPRR